MDTVRACRRERWATSMSLLGMFAVLVLPFAVAIGFDRFTAWLTQKLGD